MSEVAIGRPGGSAGAVVAVAPRQRRPQVTDEALEALEESEPARRAARRPRPSRLALDRLGPLATTTIAVDVYGAIST
jgi:hypothetical protein